MTATRELLAYLGQFPDRCALCGYAPEQQGHRGTCPERDEGQRRAEAGMARAESAHPGDVVIVDRAIAAACQSGEPFSANDFRHLVGQLDQPNVIGSRIRAALMGNRIKRVGDVPSSLPNTNAHRIGVYAPP